MKNNIALGNQKGGVILLIFAAITVIAFLAALASGMFSGGNTNTDSKQDSVVSSAVLLQATDIKTGFDLLTSENRTVIPSKVTLTNNWVTTVGSEDFGLFNSSNGYVEYVKAPANALTAASDWALDATLDIAGSTTADIVLKLTNISDSVCKEINNSLGYGSVATPAGIAVSGTVASTNDIGVYCDAGTFYRSVSIN